MGFEPKIVGFLCNWCCYAGADLAGVSRYQYPTNVRIVRMMCSARIDPVIILDTFLHGADGVFIGGCHLGDCHYISGNYFAEKKIDMTKRLLDKAGLDRDRLRLEWVSASEGVRFSEVITEFTDNISKLGQSPYLEKSLAIEAAKEAASDYRLRILATKQMELMEEGNRYGEVFTEQEMNRLLEDIINDEVDSKKILLSLKKEPLSVKELALKLEIAPERVLRMVLDLKRLNLLDVDKIEGPSPIYLAKEPQDEWFEPNETEGQVPNKEVAQIDKPEKSLLVIGSGKAGLDASLDKATNGNEVYIVERSPYLLGTESKIEELSKNQNIKIITNATIENISKNNGSYDVTFNRKAIRIDADKCDNCDECFKVCPVKAIDRYNMGIMNKNAVYSPYPGYPYLIEKETPFCQATCPVSLDIRGYIGLIADGKFKESYELIKEKNPLPSICGRVCTHPCEDMCKRGIIDEPLKIASLKRFVSDWVYDNKVEVTEPKIRKNGKKVAIVGSGPAGLACAHDLAQYGYDVTIFEKFPVAGGMLAVGIPEYRLPKDVLKKEVDLILNLGCVLKTDTEIDKDSFAKIKEEYDAVFVAVGAHLSRKLGILGEDLDGFIHGVDFLRRLNLKEEVKIGKKVAVIGGGNVAMDAARSSLRLGCEEVFIVYRRSRAEMPASIEEIEALEEEGIKTHYLAAPVKAMGKDGKLTGIECIKMELGEPDESGRRRPVPVEGSEFVIECDTVIPAIGQSSDLKLLEDSGVETPKNKWIESDKNGATSEKGVFAGGDAVTGPKTAIEAIAAGKTAALAIDEYLLGNKRPDFRLDENEIDLNEYGDIEKTKLSRYYYPTKEIEAEDRVAMPELSVESRINNFDEVETGFTEEMAIREAKRCLSCRKCIGCGICGEACPKDAIDYDQKEETLTLSVSDIILSPVLEEIAPLEAYKYLNVVTSAELKVMLDKEGLYGGTVMRPFDGEIPEKMAFTLGKNNGERGDIPDATKISKDDLIEIVEDPETRDLDVRYKSDGEEKVERFGMVVLSSDNKPSRYAKDLSKKFGLDLVEG
ncbi:MAG: NAD(P)-binding protein [Halobacteriota archaeon]|nr:NAD(P)-binding protein [Halobacteriota archaeon]